MLGLSVGTDVGSSDGGEVGPSDGATDGTMYGWKADIVSTLYIPTYHDRALQTKRINRNNHRNQMLRTLSMRRRQSMQRI